MQTDDKEITAAVKQHPEEGFRLLMARYKEPIYWHIRRLVVSHADAQDATQETFVRIFRSFGQFKGESSFTAWIYRIATNEALRLLDSRKAEWQLPDKNAETLLASATADEYVDYSDLEAVKLQQALLSLPTKQQVTFSLRYYDELGYEEIAEITGSTVSGAKANYHVAKEKIIQYMNEND